MKKFRYVQWRSQDETTRVQGSQRDTPNSPSFLGSEVGDDKAKRMDQETKRNDILEPRNDWWLVHSAAHEERLLRIDWNNGSHILIPGLLTATQIHWDCIDVCGYRALFNEHIIQGIGPFIEMRFGYYTHRNNTNIKGIERSQSESHLMGSSITYSGHCFSALDHWQEISTIPAELYPEMLASPSRNSDINTFPFAMRLVQLCAFINLLNTTSTCRLIQWEFYTGYN